MDDIVVILKTLNKYIKYLDKVFAMLVKAGIYIKLIKAFISYLSIELLGEYIDSIGLTILEEKIRAISILKFSNSLRKLKIYLSLTY